VTATLVASAPPSASGPLEILPGLHCESATQHAKAVRIDDLVVTGQ